MKDVRKKPKLSLVEPGNTAIKAQHPVLGTYYMYSEPDAQPIFTENESNTALLFKRENITPYTKDAFHSYLVEGRGDAVNPAQCGTKAALHIRCELAPAERREFCFRLADQELKQPFDEFAGIFSQRKSESDAFYSSMINQELSPDRQLVQKQAYAGLLWSKQLYYYDVEQWLNGDPVYRDMKRQEPIRNLGWEHLSNFDIISMPDKWEFPWFAAWDLAFHCLPLADLDPDFAKRQLELMTREWYMHPNGQLPAYEWEFGDVNPPVHAWGCWHVYKIDAQKNGKEDIAFLEGTFHKLLLNFTWWVNRKDIHGSNIFQGGFLGLDNIGVFDRSKSLPGGGHLDQADGTSWMAAYSLTMAKFALELGKHNPVYQDSASKFLEHFLRIATAMTNIGGQGISLWDEEDGFFYDVLRFPNGKTESMKVRSLVGLLPLIAVEIIGSDTLAHAPDVARRLHWFMLNRPHLSGNIESLNIPGEGDCRLVSLVTRERLQRIFRFLFDENEFLSPYGIRSLSKYHHHHPYELHIDGESFTVGYQPGESDSFLFGGNSNWRGPVWIPVNYLLIEALEKYSLYFGENMRVEYPTHSGEFLYLADIVEDLKKRICSIFLKDEEGKRAFFGSNHLFAEDEAFADLIQFNEYFHGDTGFGLGASHQTGWTAIISRLLDCTAEC